MASSAFDSAQIFVACQMERTVKIAAWIIDLAPGVWLSPLWSAEEGGMQLMR